MKNRLCKITLCAFLGYILSQAALDPVLVEAAEDLELKESAWPGFLSGISQNERFVDSLPLSWSPEQISWKASIRGDGQSSPVVWGENAYVTSVEGPNKEEYFLTKIRLADGIVAWTHTLSSTDPVKSTYLVSRAAPTPVCDATGIYVFYESGDVVAVDHEGQEIWKRSLTREYGKFDNKFGLAASPVQDERGIYLLIDHAGPSYLLGLSKKDGSTLWKTSRDSRRSWSSPFFSTIDGQPQIVCSSYGSVDGYDPADGKQLWSFNDVGANSAATPIVAGDSRVLLGSLVRPSEGTSEKAERSNLMGKISRKEAGWQFEVEWVAKKARGSFSSPINHDGHAYWISSAGILFCLDAATGEEKYSKRLPCGQCWATPLGIGDRIYVFGKDGGTTVVKSGPEYVELSALNQLWEPKPPQEEAESVQTDKQPNESSVKDEKPQGPTPAQSEPDPNRRRAMSRASGPIQYAAVIIPGKILIRSGDTLYCLDKTSTRTP